MRVLLVCAWFLSVGEQAFHSYEVVICFDACLELLLQGTEKFF